MRYAAIITVLWCIVFTPVEAAVTVSEIAWMGDTLSANNEWIELYNSGDATVLDGWTISDGNNFNVTLSGTIGSGAYVVLERNRADGQYLRTPPFFIYTGALVNGGATLSLRRADGGIEDQVAGGTDWVNIGGNNTTKETAQYTAVGWRTGPRTPGESNITNGALPGSSEPVAATTTATTTTSTTTTSTIGTTGGGGSSSGVRASTHASETIRLVIPNVSLSLRPSFQTTAYVNQLIQFDVTPSGLGDTWLNSLVYAWNFGDLATSSGKVTAHRYRYPGTYVVTVEAGYGRHRQVARKEITVLPVTLALARGQGGEVLLHNNAPYDVDISGYHLEGAVVNVFPARSIMGPKSTITLSPQVLGGRYYTNIVLRDAARAVVAQWPDTRAVADSEVVSRSEDGASVPISDIAVPVATTTSEGAPVTSFGVPLVVVPEPDEDDVMPAYVREALETTIPSTTVTPLVHWPYLALGVMLLVVIGSTLVTRPKMSSPSVKTYSDV